MPSENFVKESGDHKINKKIKCKPACSIPDYALSIIRPTSISWDSLINLETLLDRHFLPIHPVQYIQHVIIEFRNIVPCKSHGWNHIPAYYCRLCYVSVSKIFHFPRITFFSVIFVHYAITGKNSCNLVYISMPQIKIYGLSAPFIFPSAPPSPHLNSILRVRSGLKRLPHEILKNVFIFLFWKIN